jgi:hypothetical protein
MAYNGIAKVQHYVPRFLLRNFGTGKKDKLHVFDKQVEKTFATNIKNVAAESRYYDFELEGRSLTIEPGLSMVESFAKPIVKSILDADSLAHITPEDRAKLSIFLAIQFTRTKWFREQYRDLPKQLEAAMRRKEGEDADLSAIAEHFKEPDDNELTIQIARFIAEAPKELAIHFANKIWVLLATDSKHPFLIGDHPIGLQNMIDMAPYGNLGLAVRGIEIYFPLSPRQALAMWCPSFEEFFRRAVRDGRGSGAQEVLAAMESGSPLEYTPEHVLNFNSIQVRHAERFIFSSTDDFSLARRMVADHESYRTGPRSTTN